MAQEQNDTLAVVCGNASEVKRNNNNYTKYNVQNIC